MAQYPFLNSSFLSALEDSASTTAATGWEPCHLTINSSTTDDITSDTVFMPLYTKTHSYGEYVFDWAWADAYRRNGLHYYPKLLTAIPFSPATGPRLRFADNSSVSSATHPAIAQNFMRQIKTLAEDIDASGWHLLFPDKNTLQLFSGEALKEVLGEPLIERSGVQFHWFNGGSDSLCKTNDKSSQAYENFDHFLEGFVSRKRKMVRRERRSVSEQGLSVVMLPGEEIRVELWDFFFRLYQNTYLKRSGNGGYLTREFFRQIGETMAEQIAMAVAYDQDEPVACALYFYDSDTLYGRYWGCVREYDHLHFELCYYQGIDFAIAKGLKKFDAGAQGEHKLLRGFEPVETFSLHWIRHPGFAEAIANFTQQEKAANTDYIAQARSVLPYRNESGN